MTKLNRFITPALVALAFIGNAGGSQAMGTYALVCEVTYSYKSSGESGPTTGEYTIIVEDRQNRPEIVSMSGVACETVTKEFVSDAQIYLQCKNNAKGKTYITTFSIDRYSGKFEYSLSSGGGFLQFMGECHKAKRRF